MFMIWNICLLQRLSYVAQDLRNSARRTLEKVVAENVNDMDLGLRYKAGIVGRRLGEVDISPYNLFKLSHSNYLGIMTTLITYIIVLMQFKGAV